MKGLRDFLVGSCLSKIENFGLRARAARMHLFAERKHLAKILFELDAGDKRALTPLAVRNAQIAKRFECMARGHSADAGKLRDFLFRRNGLTCFPVASANLLEQVLLDLVIKRHAAVTIKKHKPHEAPPLV